MFTARVRWSGDLGWLRDTAARANGQQIEELAIRPWERWLLNERILNQYRDRGRIRNSPLGRWLRNTPHTQGAKGHDRPMLSRRQFRFGSMARSYQVVTRRRGSLIYVATLSNRARSASGFDYPSFLHEGGNERKRGKIIRPRDARALRFIGAGGATFFAKSVRYNPPPPRPHILFVDDDAEQLGARILDAVLEGKSHSSQRRVSV